MTRRAHLVALVVVLGGLGGFGGHHAAARPGGGQNYRSGDSPSTNRPSSSSSSGSSSDRYRPSSSSSGSSYRPGSPSSSASSASSTLRPNMTAEEYFNIRVDPLPPSEPPKNRGLGVALVLCFFFAMIILLLWWVGRRRTKREAVSRATIRVNPIIQQRSVEALKERDAGFDAQAFTARTQAVVTTVNKAWLAGDLGPARRVISDGVYVRFTTQLELLRAQGLRNAMADWRVVSVELLSADTDELWDTVEVKVVGAARDLDLPAELTAGETQKRLQRAPVTEYDEAWAFVRRRGKNSVKGVPALEGRCPSCGATLPLSDVVRCEYCQALINSGEHDWVLAEITQAEEWRAGAAVKSIAGLDALRERDPGVSRQELEDRVSVSFWKWIEACSTGKPDKLARFCLTPPQDEKARAALALVTSKLQAVAVGSADLKRVDAKGDVDRASLEVRWSASTNGQPPANHRHTFVLGRAAAARSKRGLSSLDCPSCGGALAKSDEVVCSYCGTALTGGKYEWGLIEVRERKDEA